MKSILVKLSTLVCMLGICATASADFREVFTCTINEGKTMDDVRAANSRWVKFMNAKLAIDAIAEAIAQGGDPSNINEAEHLLNMGDTLRASGAFEDAINEYKDTLDQAEDALKDEDTGDGDKVVLGGVCKLQPE